MSDSIEKLKKSSEDIVKKELLAAGIAALVSLPGKERQRLRLLPRRELKRMLCRKKVWSRRQNFR